MVQNLGHLICCNSVLIDTSLILVTIQTLIELNACHIYICDRNDIFGSKCYFVKKNLNNFGFKSRHCTVFLQKSSSERKIIAWKWPRPFQPSWYKIIFHRSYFRLIFLIRCSFSELFDRRCRCFLATCNVLCTITVIWWILLTVKINLLISQRTL